MGTNYGFKEWALICAALGRGEQSVILRKGGIAEGRAGFRFAHEEFALLPTLFHEQVRQLHLPAGTPLPTARQDGMLEIRYRARVEWTRVISDAARLPKLAPFHLWREEVIDERFRWKGEGISLALVRVYRLSAPWVFPDAPAYGGCRSWVGLPEMPAGWGEEPVLAEAAHRGIEQQIERALG